MGFDFSILRADCNSIYNFFIIISVKPVFDPSFVPPVFNIMEGASQVINLTAKSNPPNSTYTLSRAGVVLSPGDIGSFTLEGGALTVSGISRHDGGQYTVMAVNSEGMTRYNFTLNVQCKYCSIWL